MSLFFSGSDGNIYTEPYEGTLTGSLYKTKFVEYTDDEYIEDESSWVPGIQFDTSIQEYWIDIQWASAQRLGDSDVSPTYDSGSQTGCIWVYNLTDSQKSTIESDADYIATYVTSSL